MLTLITGGARSGKSTAAARLAAVAERPVHVVATARAGDDEMANRIGRHRAERPRHWVTHEEPLEVTRVVAAIDPGDVVVVDCLGMWVTNQIDDRGDDEILTAAGELAARLAERPGPSVVVTNEVGSGIVPDNPLARRFRDLLGHVNQRVAEQADAAYLAVSGRLLTLDRPENLGV